MCRIVHRFAQALDDDDYVAAAACLAERAQYDTSEKIIIGSDQIVESFRAASEKGRNVFDSVEFRHEIDPNAPLDIRFIDVLQLDGEEFVLDHTMSVKLSDDGLICGLQLTYPPGERTRLGDFLRRHNRT